MALGSDATPLDLGRTFSSRSRDAIQWYPLRMRLPELCSSLRQLQLFHRRLCQPHSTFHELYSKRDPS
uniref:Uncharacterized protein n=1 Tax=Psilocybe cubensis TaxID=181762 RepID=A0A8H7XXJ2_PSICU